MTTGWKTLTKATENAGIIYHLLLDAPELAANVTSFRGDGDRERGGYQVTIHARGGASVAAAWLEELGPCAREHPITRSEVDGEVRTVSTLDTLVHISTGVQ